MAFENGVKNVQAAAYNGARTVYEVVLFKILNLKKIQILYEKAETHPRRGFVLQSTSKIGI